MTPSSNDVSRRGFLAKIALLFNGFVGIALAVPIVRYLASPVTRERNAGSNSWLTLGRLDKFPAGETRLAAGSDNYPDCSEARFFLPLDLRGAFLLATVG
jgi:hypothetical protein